MMDAPLGPGPATSGDSGADQTDPRAWSRLLLVEGVPGVGKSTLLDQLARRHVAQADPCRLRTLVHLTQAHTYGPLAPAEDAGTLTRVACLEHLDAVVDALTWLATSLRAERKPKCFVLVDCLHLTACLRPGVVTWPDVEDADRRLALVGARLVLLDATDETVAARSVGARSGTQFIEGYARRRFGATDAQLVSHFQWERDQFLSLFAQSAMTKLDLQAEDPPARLADVAYEFWHA